MWWFLPTAVHRSSHIWKKRIGENKVERSVDDILAIFNALDECDERSWLPVFCAASLSRIPVIAEELSDMVVVKKELEYVKKH